MTYQDFDERDAVERAKKRTGEASRRKPSAVSRLLKAVMNRRRAEAERGVDQAKQNQMPLGQQMGRGMMPDAARAMDHLPDWETPQCRQKIGRVRGIRDGNDDDAVKFTAASQCAGKRGFLGYARDHGSWIAPLSDRKHQPRRPVLEKRGSHEASQIPGRTGD